MPVAPRGRDEHGQPVEQLQGREHEGGLPEGRRFGELVDQVLPRSGPEEALPGNPARTVQSPARPSNAPVPFQYRFSTGCKTALNALSFPQTEDGMRIEPPPSDPVANGTMPAAMAAADPAGRPARAAGEVPRVAGGAEHRVNPLP